jgi:hypothetical protein
MPKCGFKECRRPATGDGSLPWSCEECAQELNPEIERLSDQIDQAIEDDIQKN